MDVAPKHLDYSFQVLHTHLVVLYEHLRPAKQGERILNLSNAPMQRISPLQLAWGLQHKRQRLAAGCTHALAGGGHTHTCISACTDARLRSSAASISTRSSSPISLMPTGRLGACLAACMSTCTDTWPRCCTSPPPVAVRSALPAASCAPGDSVAPCHTRVLLASLAPGRTGGGKVHHK